MADEFMTGGSFLAGGGFLWMLFAGIYKTPDFQRQLGFPADTHPPKLGIPHQAGVFFADLFFALMILGPLVWWIVIPTAKWVVVKHRRAQKTSN
ncbi:MAG: hypothetical protein ABEK59_00525 [Halobacteria archaeon]